ncbi:TIGR04104 family putative zinc finger protein [Halobacillus sp. H74]|uniref:TIGR04104 family putative zinc finger protein n=1 Tax=Halobacillus sp. H74 TaxID=3457436 RepID=UPI003FCD2F13
MPICQSCGNKWSWKQSVKSLFRFSRKMKCPYCGEMQYQSQDSMKKGSLVALIPIILAPIITMVAQLFFSLEPLFGFVLMIYVLLMGLFFSITPFVLRLSNKEEPLW